MSRSSVPPLSSQAEVPNLNIDRSIEDFIIQHMFYSGEGNLPMKISLSNGFVLRAVRDYKPSESNYNESSSPSRDDIEFVKSQLKKGIKDIKAGREFVLHGMSGTDYLTLYIKLEEGSKNNAPYSPEPTRRVIRHIVTPAE